MALFFVDCEAFRACPRLGRLTEFGIVAYPSKETFHGVILDSTPNPDLPAEPLHIELTDEEYYAKAKPVFERCAEWLAANSNTRTKARGRAIMVSDNPAYDFQWINDGFLVTRTHLPIEKRNPFGHSARRISDFYAGLMGDFYKTQEWKSFRRTPHDHNPVNDSMGNVEAFETMLEMASRPKFTHTLYRD